MVIRFFRRLAALSTVTGMRFTTVNGAPAVLLRYSPARPGWPSAAVLQARLDADGRIAALDSLVEPGKLAALRG